MQDSLPGAVSPSGHKPFVHLLFFSSFSPPLPLPLVSLEPGHTLSCPHPAAGKQLKGFLSPQGSASLIPRAAAQTGTLINTGTLSLCVN